MEFLSKISGIHLSDFGDPVFWMAVGSIILIDLILSGDNAILIAMACRNLPPELRTKGVIWGTAGAIGLRMILGAAIIYLLKIPLLQAAGACLLAWIAIKLLVQEEEHETVDAPDRLWQAVKTIIVADAVMSLDNVMAVAGVSHGKPGLLWFGLLVSIPLVVYGSRLFLTLIDRFSIILYGGSAILGWAAGNMLAHDPLLMSFLKDIGFSSYLLGEKILGIFFAVLVLLIGWFMNARQKQKTTTMEV
ncbi:TerC family protein [Heliobacterium mobile]|nr:TerC family protein [Heliobacterium mobile]